MHTDHLNSPPLEKRSYLFVDMTKYFAAIMVILIHTNPFGLEQDSILYTFWYTILRNALPFFFVSSAYFFFKKHNWGKYLKRLFILYFSWFVVAFVYVLFIKFYDPSLPFRIKFLSFCKDLVWNGALPGAWYVFASIHSIALLYLLTVKLKFNNTLLVVIGLCFYCVAVLNSTYYGLADGNGFLSGLNGLLGVVMPSPAHSFFSAFIFFVIGKILAERRSGTEVCRCVAGIICFGMLEFVETGLLHHYGLIRENDYFFMLIPVAWYFFQLCMAVNIPLSVERASYLRKSSTIYYFSQFPVIFLCGPITKYLPCGVGMANFVITIVAVSVLSYLVIRYSGRYKVLKNLY